MSVTRIACALEAARRKPSGVLMKNQTKTVGLAPLRYKDDSKVRAILLTLRKYTQAGSLRHGRLTPRRSHGKLLRVGALRVSSKALRYYRNS